MMLNKCSICDGPVYDEVKVGFGGPDEEAVCGMCVGYLAVINNRLNQITRYGVLTPDLTAIGPEVPDDEK
jgi:hypothetical protein